MEGREDRMVPWAVSWQSERLRRARWISWCWRVSERERRGAGMGDGFNKHGLQSAGVGAHGEGCDVEDVFGVAADVDEGRFAGDADVGVQGGVGWWGEVESRGVD